VPDPRSTHSVLLSTGSLLYTDWNGDILSLSSHIRKQKLLKVWDSITRIEFETLINIDHVVAISETNFFEDYDD
jgi:hypothetical protein